MKMHDPKGGGSAIPSFASNDLPPPLPISDKAKEIHSRLKACLVSLRDLNASSPLQNAFKSRYREAMDLFARYQDAVIAGTDYKVSCHSGCTSCCFHWVEDVYSFEAEIIAEYVKQHYPDIVGDIVSVFKEDIRHIQVLDRNVAEGLAGNAQSRGVEQIDPVDLLLASFYQLRRPCPFLAHDGTCGIYPVRPITCRIYVSFSDPKFCCPEYIHDAEIRTYLLDMEEDASEVLDEIHKRFDIYDGDMGLRSVLVTCLTGEHVQDLED